MSPVDRPRAVVLGVQFPDVSQEEHRSSLEELERLATTLGLDPVGRVVQRRRSLSPAAVVGRGKLQELARWTGGTGQVPSGAKVRVQRKDRGSSATDPETELTSEDEEDVDVDAPRHERRALERAGLETDGDLAQGEIAAPGGKPVDVVLVDHDLTPSQLRNLERATGAEVLDRSSVILSIFQRHARTREARVQVEIARLAYMSPRLRETNAGEDRQRGGIGGKGAGESSLELDRRKIRDRIAELRGELASIEREAGTRRKRRNAHATIALVGYTNAGKSSLMRALTGSEVYVADKLFATLDTTVRALYPPTKPPMMVSDTVGFIKKLPHDLVASFRSTLEEAREADILLHVVDASDPAHSAQMEVTRSVLGEIGAGDAIELLVLNKADRLTDDEKAELRARHPHAVLLSAHSPEDVARLHARLADLGTRGMLEAEVFVPYDDQRRVHAIYEVARVLEEKHDEHGTSLVFIAPEAVVRSVGGQARLPRSTD